MTFININEIENFRIGHAENKKGGTGCTVIICAKGAITGVDVRGGAPGTRETDLLNPINLVPHAHGVLLTGGSAFGLDSAAGVMQYLEEHGIGFDVGVTSVPIVCGAALFDLPFGDHRIRPDKKMGFAACVDSENPSDKMGNVGAGFGATVGKIKGQDFSMKGGLGFAAMKVGKLEIGAVVAVNCLGNVINPNTLEMLAGPLDINRQHIDNTEQIMIDSFNEERNLFSGNTTLGTVITNGNFSKAQCSKLAGMSQNGFARTLRPAHTMVDGDTIFFMSCGEVKADQNLAGTLAAKVIEQAVINAIINAKTLYGVKSYSDIKNL